MELILMTIKIMKQKKLEFINFLFACCVILDAIGISRQKINFPRLSSIDNLFNIIYVIIVKFVQFYKEYLNVYLMIILSFFFLIFLFLKIFFPSKYYKKDEKKETSVFEYYVFLIFFINLFLKNRLNENLKNNGKMIRVKSDSFVVILSIPSIAHFIVNF